MANVIKHKRGSGSDPGASDLVVGEVAIRTDTGKLFTKMDNGSVAEIAGGGSDIAINTLSSSSGTGGGSATFNGSAYRFTLSSPPSVSAQQLLVSINGVIQKPVAGTGQPSEGFSVDGNDIILGDAPATGADFFIVTFKSLGVSEPADNSVTSAKIADGAIVNADINASAAIAGTKIAPDFGSQNISTTGNVGIGTTSPDGKLDVRGTIFVNGDGTGGRIFASSGNLSLSDGNGRQVLRIDDPGAGNSHTHIFDSNGRLGIGTTSPSQELTVFGDNPVISVQESSVSSQVDIGTGTTTGFINIQKADGTRTIQFSGNGVSYLNGGNVGIGTTSPTVTLDIEATTPTIRLTDSDASGTPECEIKGGGGDLVLSADRDNEKSGTKIQFQTDGSTKITIDEVGRLGVGTTSPSGFNAYANTLVAATSTNTGLTLSGNDASTNYSGIQFSAGTTVRAYVDQQLNSTGRMRVFNMANGFLEFGTNNEIRMHITADGKIGVGTTSPSSKFHCDAGTSVGASAGMFENDDNTAYSSAAEGHFNTPLILGSTTTTGQNDQSVGIQFSLSLSGQTGSIQEIGAVRTGNGQGALVFRTRNSSTGRVERMRIDSAGRVCIGVNDALHAHGNSDDLCVGNNDSSSSHGITIGSNVNGSIRFADSASGGAGRLEYIHGTANLFKMYANGTADTTSVLGLVKPNGPSDAATTMITFESGNQARGQIKSSSSDSGNPSFAAYSDYRMKENIRDYTGGWNNIKAVPVKLFDVKTDGSKDQKGWIAHELQAVLPDLVQGTKDAVVTQAMVDSEESDEEELGNPIYQTVSMGLFMPDVISALQTAIAKIETLETKVAALEAG